ncbi:MAG: polysaccharide biosynthesis tyrosine autokinase [Anaerolineales bacterium]
MELRQYLIMLRRWFWVLLLGILLGGAAGYIGSLFQTPVYRTESKVMISQPSRDQLSEMGYLNSYQLIQTYSELLVTTPILDEVSERLNYNVRKDQISTQLIQDTQIMEISVEDTDPVMAAVIATLLSDVLVEYNEEIQMSRFEALEESLSSQIQVIETQIKNLQSEIELSSSEFYWEQRQQIENQINSLQAEIVELKLDISKLTPESGTPNAKTQTLINQKELQLEQTEGMLAEYQELYFNIITSSANGDSTTSTSVSSNEQSQTNLALYQQMYAGLLSDYEAIRLARLENTPIVAVVEPAKLKSSPIRPRPVNNALLGSVVGLLIAGGIVFAIEYFDDTIKTPEDVKRNISQPIIGYISEIPISKKNGKGPVYVSTNPRSPVAEAFRSLRTNIEFAGESERIKSILITSPGPGEGKSTIASNLAMVMIQGGKRSILIDADLRKPSIHRNYGMDNNLGLSGYLSGENEYNQITNTVEHTKRLQVIFSGKIPTGPAEMLNSRRMDFLIEELSESADFLIIDSPPLLVTDPLVLSTKVDGVLLVVKPESTRQVALVGAIEQLERANARLLGIVLNKITRRTAYYYQHYYSNYYSSYDYFSEEGEK